MNEYNYLIADLLFQVTAESGFRQPRDEYFRLRSTEAIPQNIFPKINVTCRMGSLSETGIQLPIGSRLILYKMDGSSYTIYYCNDRNQPVHIIRGDMDFKQYESESVLSYGFPFESCVGEVIFRTAILNHKGIVIHSAGIECSGNGIIFSAPSGTGKSTQANLWREYKGASVLNGDRSALRIIDGKPVVSGSLWSGSSPDSLNKTAPLKAVVMLRQASENRLQILSPNQAITEMLPRCYLPNGSPELTDMALKNLEAIVQLVPVYMFECRPDRMAVDMVGRCVGVE